jgi:hypothetical protein
MYLMFLCHHCLQRHIKAPMELQQLQLEIVISEDTERETQRQSLKVCMQHSMRVQESVCSMCGLQDSTDWGNGSKKLACCHQLQHMQLQSSNCKQTLERVMAARELAQLCLWCMPAALLSMSLWHILQWVLACSTYLLCRGCALLLSCCVLLLQQVVEDTDDTRDWRTRAPPPAAAAAGPAGARQQGLAAPQQAAAQQQQQQQPPPQRQQPSQVRRVNSATCTLQQQQVWGRVAAPIQDACVPHNIIIG